MAFHTHTFVRVVRSVVEVSGMPHMRQVFVPMPVMGKTPRELRAYIDGNDPMSALSEAELQAAAEQRIRHMVLTFHYLERHIREMIALCDAKSGQTETSAGPGPFEGEKAQHLHPHPAFLM